jgi:recombination protein RecA
MAKTKVKEEFKCPQCDWVGKTKGSLTQHMKREHEGDELAALRADFGVNAPMPGGALNKEHPLTAAPSGIPSIDLALGIGGIPRGTIIEIFGPPRAGKTLTALQFIAQAQKMGERCGFEDLEHALSETFLALTPDLNAAALEYSEPDNGTQALEMSRRFIQTGLFGVWLIDSVHACIPEWALDTPIGSSKQRAAVAQLMSEALPILAAHVAKTNTSVVLINHIKKIPGQTHGKDWYTPGGSAPEYYSSTRLNVWQSGSYIGKESKKQIGHRVKVKVEKSKVTAPFTTAEYDLYYYEDIRKDTGLLCKPGIDVASSWLWCLLEEQKVTRSSSGQIIDLETGEKLGAEPEVLEMLRDPESELLLEAKKLVYPEQYNRV